MTGLGLLLIVLLLILLLALLVFVAFRSGLIDKLQARRLRPEREGDEIAPPTTLGTAVSIALAELRSRTGAAADLRDVPWALVLGAEMPALDALLPPDQPPEHRVTWLGRSGVERAGLISFRERGVVLGFQDGLVGGPNPEGRLLDLLRRLELARPGRPIDSLVLAVPASLLAANAQDPMAQQQAEAHGRKLYELVLAAQSRTGWRVPIYLLVTGADAIEGFGETAAAILAHARSPMIGWASTHPIDTSFEPSWIEAAFAQMHRDLLVAQCHLLMGLDDPAIARRALAFPHRMAALRPLLTLLLLQILNASAYHEGFMLRGVFFTGATSDDAPAPLAIGGPDPVAKLPATADAPDAPAPPAPQPLAAALFRDKVFPEHGLAQPAYGERTRRHRMLGRTRWALAAAVVVFVTGNTLLAVRSQEALAPVERLLAKIKPPGSASGTACQDPANETSSAADLLRGLADIQIDGLESVLAPTSFLTGTTDHVRQAIATSVRSVIFIALAERMTTKEGIKNRLSQGLPQPKDLGYWPAYVSNLKTFDANYRELNELRGTKDAFPATLRRFGKVASYALDENLPDLAQRDQLYARAFAAETIPCVNPDKARRIVEGLVDEAYGEALDGWYRNDPTVKRILEIDSEFGSETSVLAPVGDDARAAAAVSLARLQRLSTALDDLSVQLPNADRAAWTKEPLEQWMLTSRQFEGHLLIDGETLQRIRERHQPRATEWVVRIRNARLAGAPLLQIGPPGPAVTVLPAAAGEIAVGTAPAADAPAGPAPTAGAAVAGPTLSAAASESQAMLHDVFAQPFAHIGDTATLPVPKGLWDLPRLQAFEQLAKKYLAFRDSVPAAVPQPIVLATAEAVRTRVGRYIAIGTIASTVKANSSSTVEATNFVLALPALQSLRRMLREFGEWEGAFSLATAINTDAADVFKAARDDLDREGGPYAVDRDGLAAWRGQGSLGAAAFATGTVENLKATLPQRRAWVAQIARGRVAPVVAYALDPINAAPIQLVARAQQWSAILRALENYDAGPGPTNSLARLERFMTADLDLLQAQGCASIGQVKPRGGDYFANQQLRISAEVFRRCRPAVLADLVARYARLRDGFQATLAGRFPFGPIDAPDADPEQVRAFFQRFGGQIGPLQAALEDVRIGGAAAAELGRLLAAQTALAPMLTGNDAAPLRYQAGVQFFTDPMLASGQDQVIEAMIGTTFSRAATNAASYFVWNVGEPVIARFRWASNAPSLPLAGLAVPNGPCRPAPDGAWASARTPGAWALLRLLRSQGTDLDAAAATSGYPVAYGFDLCANLAGAVGGDAPMPRARILLRLTLSAPPAAPEKPALPILLPGFPTALPTLDSSARGRR